MRKSPLLLVRGTKLRERGTTTDGARRNNNSKMLNGKTFRAAATARMDHVTPPAMAILAPDGKRVSSVFMAANHIPWAREAAPYVAARNSAAAVKATSPQRFSLRRVAS